MCEESHFPDDGDSSDPELENDWKTPRAESTTTSSQRPTRVSTASEIDLTSSAVPTFSQSQEVIELDDESSDESAVELKPTTSSRIEKHGGKGTEMIVLDCDDEDESVDATEALPLEDSGLDERLMFSVSKNTGRITIHFPANGGPSPVNFEVEQVVSGETVDILLNARIERASGPRPPLQVEFNQRRIQLLLDRLHNVGGFFDERRDVYAQEIKEFVSNCLKLREAEKKALKDSGRAFPAAGLSQAVAGLMSRAVYSTERYTGGAKERAREREKDGTSTETDRAVLAGEACAMCGKRLSAACTAAGSAYCSQDCAEEGRLCRGGMYASSKIRAAVFALEGGKCTLCGIDAHSLFEQIRALEPARRLNKLLAVNWRLPTSSKALQNLLQDPKEHHFWQADHIRAVAEGGGGCGVENLRTLCVPCHAQETEKLRGRLPLHKPFESDSGNKRKQTDIRSAFSVAAKRARND
jgi:5-methylcytosine-specific restriction endonuclease McrA